MKLPYPEITQQEFCDHIEDDDFFLAYGNPVVIRADSGTKLLAIAFPMWERLMRNICRGEEIELIKKECAEREAADIAKNKDSGITIIKREHCSDDLRALEADPHYTVIRAKKKESTEE